MIDEHTGPADALKIALGMEIKAYETYRKAAKFVKSPSTKKMFEFLAEEEKRHEALIRGELDKGFLREG